MTHPIFRGAPLRAAICIVAAFGCFQAQAAVHQVPGGYHTIQSAIDAAKDGDTIRVAAGSYTEQLSIRKSLTIVGAGDARTVVRAPRHFRKGLTGRNSIVEILQGARVSLSSLSVRGPGRGTCEDNALFAGIVVLQGSHLNLDRSRVANIHDTPAALCPRSGVAVQIGDGESGSTGTARITRSQITNYQTGGIVVLNTGSHAEIVDNVVTGPGHSAKLVTDGIEFVLGANGTIARNVVSGNVCGVPDLGCGADFLENFQLSGIAGGGPGTKIFENVVFANQVGIYVSEAADVRDNLLLSNDLTGLALQDGSFHVSGGMVFGGGADGVAAIAAFSDTRARLKGVRITDTDGPAVRKLECCGFHASVKRSGD